ncbi:MAG: hypothetical protein AAF492_21570, partial [Verrucomicrobiota bacterium]
DYWAGGVTRINMGGGQGNFQLGNGNSTEPYPGGFGGDDFLVRVRALVTIPPGTWTIAVGSDDGRYLELEGMTFSDVGGQNNLAAGGVGTSIIGWESPTGHNNSRGVFTLTTNATMVLTSLFWDRGGGDSYEISIAPGSHLVGGLPGPFELLQNGAFGWMVRAERPHSNEVTLSEMRSSGSCPGEEILTRTWTYTDDCGEPHTAMQTVTIRDTLPPEIICPTNITLEWGDDTGPNRTGTSIVTDNCDTNPTITYSETVVGTWTQIITRICTAIDSCGNSNSCTQIIVVDDTTAPNIVCPPDLTLECGEDTGTHRTGEATATDNCDTNVLIFYTESITGNWPQVMTRIWSAIDDCNNQTQCVQTIIIDDTIAPTFTTVPPDLTLECTTGPKSLTPGDTIICTGSGPGLDVRIYNGLSGATNLQTISALLGNTNYITGLFENTNLIYSNLPGFQAAYPGLATGDTFTLIWSGFWVVNRAELGTYTLGTASDDGSVWYVDL